MDPTDPRPEERTAALVERAKRGDREAYDRLFARAAERTLLSIGIRLGPT